MRRYKVQRGRIVTFAICAFAGLLGTAASGANGPTPVSAKVMTPGAAVHSGPGDNYYLTDTLPEGEMVEVYRRRDDGWCAVRPPAGSFSWVFASNVQLDDEGLAKVTKDGTASRIGSRLSSHRDVVQVRLHKGETVKIVGKDEDGGETWYKISPPAGEFRWVAGNCLALTESADGAEAGGVTQTSHDEPATSAASAKSWDLMPPPLVSTADPPAPTAKPATPAASSPSTNAATTSSAAPIAATTSAAAVASPTPVAAKAVVSTPAATAGGSSADKSASMSPATDVTPIVAPTAASPETARQLSELELKLSRMVAEPPATWNIEALQQSAEQLLSKADTAADRDAVKVTLAKIDRFGAIQRRSVAMGTGGMASGATTGSISPMTVTPLPGVAQTGAAAAGTSNNAGGQFDAVGVLRPVVSRRPGAPQFALVDDKGQVVTFVTPSPDINLQPYLGRRIGVLGSRGYIPEFHRAHVMAGRVTPLGDTVLR